MNKHCQYFLVVYDMYEPINRAAVLSRTRSVETWLLNFLGRCRRDGESYSFKLIAKLCIANSITKNRSENLQSLCLTSFSLPPRVSLGLYRGSIAERHRKEWKYGQTWYDFLSGRVLTC